jgi:hypothetical protein
VTDAHHRRHALSRRSLIAGTSGMLLLAAAPARAAAPAPAGPAGNATGAARASRITQGTTLVHADLHNHTLMSDGDGDPARAFASMRSAGLDVAALTDHSTLFAIDGLSRSEWATTGALADAADDPGLFTAIRGFEWSHPLLGHVNVWFTPSFTDLGGSASMGALYNWVRSAGGIASFNHPGREIGRFGNFAFEAGTRDHFVGLEMFNRTDDYLFDGWSSGRSSPLNACLNAGWRTGLSGVSDEHGADWGHPEGKGRTGLWVTENTRAQVQEAMRARRFFATRESGLRVDATANGVRMGGDVTPSRGDVTFTVDIDRGPEWIGLPLQIQVLRPGTRAPRVVDVVTAESGRITTFTTPMTSGDGTWAVLRIADPARANATPGPAGHPANNYGVAYASPFWLVP